jgi:hypothetical protein
MTNRITGPACSHSQSLHIITASIAQPEYPPSQWYIKTGSPEWEHPGLDKAIEASKGQKIRGLQERLERFQRTRDSVSKYLKDAMEVQKKYYDAQHEPIEFGTGDFVLLSTKNLNIKRPKRSLWPKYVGPFEILEPCGKQAYRLKLPSTWRIYNIINVSRLEKWRSNKYPYERPVIIPDEVEFENR